MNIEQFGIIVQTFVQHVKNNIFQYVQKIAKRKNCNVQNAANKRPKLNGLPVIKKQINRY